MVRRPTRSAPALDEGAVASPAAAVPAAAARTSHLRRLAGETLIYGLGAAFSGLLNLLLLPLYAHAFSPADFGRVGLVTTLAALVSIFSSLALDNSAARWYWDTEDPVTRRQTIASWLWCQLAVSSGLAATLILLGGQFGSVLLGKGVGVSYLRLALVAVPATAVPAVTINWLRLQRRAVATTLYTLIWGVLTTGCVALLLLVAHLGPTGLFLGELIASCAMTLGGVLILREWANPLLLDRSLLRAMLRYSGPLIPSALAFWVVGVSDRFLVDIFRGVREVGIYQMSNTLAAAVALVTMGFQQAWGPFAFSLHRDDDAREMYADVFLGFVVIGCAAATAVSLLAPDVLRMIAATRYLSATSGVFPLALGNVMMGLTYIAGLGPSLLKKTGAVGAAITVAAVLNIVLNLALIPALGRAGAGYSTLIAESLVPVYLFRRSQQLYPVPYRFAIGAGVVTFAIAINGTVSHLQLTDEPVSVVVKLAALLLFVPLAGWLRIGRSLRGAPLSRAVA